MPAGGGQIPAVALRGYGVDAAAMSFWLHDRGIHIECGPQGPGAGDTGVTEADFWAGCARRFRHAA
jgi:hypothetical protein